MWLSTDPLSGYNPVFEHEHYIDGQHNGGVYNSGNLNTYAYTYQNPVIYVDPNGKQTKNGFVVGLKDGFVGTFKAGYKLVTEPVKTLKETVSNYSWEDYGDVLGNSFTLGQYDYFKATYKAATGDEYGAGKIMGQKVAEASIALVTEGTGRAVNGVKGAKVTGVVATDYQKLLTSTSEFDPVKTLYRGTTGSESSSSILFATDDVLVAASYAKNGGQVVKYELSSSGLYNLEQTGQMTKKIGMHGTGGKVSTEYMFEGKELIKTLNDISKPVK